MMTTKGFQSSCFGVEDIRLGKVWGGVGGNSLFLLPMLQKNVITKKKKQNYAHISPLQKTNLPLQKLGNLALG